MNAALKPLTWADVKIKVGWLNVAKERRVYASLIGLGMVGWVGWFEQEWTATPAQKACILLALQRRRAQVLKKWSKQAADIPGLKIKEEKV
jgi:hypothetical protein